MFEDGYMRKNFKTKYSKKILNLATHIVDKDCTNIDGTPITGESRDILIFEFCENMRLGSKIHRKEYICVGVFLGAAITVGAIKVQKMIKKRKIEA